MSSLFAPVEIVGGIAVGTGVGAAVGDVVLPKLQDFLNSQWEAHPDKPLAARDVAAAIAEALPGDGGGASEAARTGFDAGRLAVLTNLSLTAPGSGELLRLLRRGFIGPGEFTHGLRKAKLETLWDAGLGKLRDELLDPAVIAVAIQRGIIADPGILPVGPPTGTGKVPRFPVFPIDALAEAAGSGVSRDRLSVMVGNVGLPMSPDQAASATFRGIIERVDFDRAIAEGNTRNEWADAIFEQARYIISPADAAGLRLRGWRTKAEAEALGARYGASPETMEELYLNRGRPATTHQVHVGYQRGGRLAGVGDDERATFKRAVLESDIRPEWEPILWAQRYTYPSAFVLRALVSDGTFTQAQGEQILIEAGWNPVYAKQAAAKWAGAAGGVGKSETKSELADEYETGFISEGEYRTALTALGFVGHQQDLEVLHSDAAAVKTERARVVTALHKLYVGHKIDDAQARADLASAGMHDAAIGRVLPLWTLERDAARHELTDAQIRAAYRKALLTLDAAVAELVSRGYSDADARTYLAS